MVSRGQRVTPAILAQQGHSATQDPPALLAKTGSTDSPELPAPPAHSVRPATQAIPGTLARLAHRDWMVSRVRLALPGQREHRASLARPAHKAIRDRQALRAMTESMVCQVQPVPLGR